MAPHVFVQPKTATTIYMAIAPVMQLYASCSCLAEAQRKLRRKRAFKHVFSTWDVSQHPVSHVAGG